jgi:DNA-binding transcriptional ArsR family regulator
MDRTTPAEGDPEDERDVKERRLEHPSGWLALTRHEGVLIIVDALLDLPPHREFNKSELAAHAGVTRQTVSRHADRLVELDVIEPVPETTPTRYRVADGDVVEQLFELNAALNAAADDSE